MKNNRKKMIISFIVLLLIAVTFYFYFQNKKGAWSTAFEWSGIQTLPVWAEKQDIEVKGGFFTREFRITFTGSKEEIEQWEKTEPVFKDLQKEWINDSTYMYVLKPQGGAQRAEVRINLINNEVLIRTYWS